MINFKNIINTALQRNFLAEMRKYISAFVPTYVSGRLATAERLHVLTMGASQAAVTTSPYYASRWVGTHADITELYTGLVVVVKVPVAGNGSYGTVLNVNGLGEHPVCANVNSMVSTRYAVGCFITLIYDADQTAPVNLNSASQTSVKGVWKIADYDSTNTYQLRHYYGNYKAAAILYRYKLLLQSKDGLSLIPVSSADTTATTKVMTTEKFNPYGQILYYSSGTTIQANADITAYNLYYHITLDIRRSFNVSSVTANKDVFIVAVPQADGMAVLDSGTAITQDLPTTEDGKIYIYLGHAYATTAVELHVSHPIYCYKDGAIRLWNGQSDAAAVREAGFVRPEWWHDGGDDWTEAFQSALDNGSTIVLTAGKTYSFAGTSLQTKHDTIIEGNGAHIVQQNASWLTVKHHCTVRNLTVTDAYDGTSTSHYGVYVNNADVEVQVENVTFNSPVDKALKAVKLTSFGYAEVRKCTFSFSGETTAVRNGVALSTKGEERCVVEDCTFTAETYSANIRFLSFDAGGVTDAKLYVKRCRMSGGQQGILSGGTGANENTPTTAFEDCVFDNCSYMQCWASSTAGTERRTANISYRGCEIVNPRSNSTFVYLQNSDFNEYNITIEKCRGVLRQAIIYGNQGTYGQDMRLTIRDSVLTAVRFGVHQTPPTFSGRIVTTIENSTITCTSANPYIYGTDIRLRDVEVVLGNSAANQKLLIKPADGWGTVDIRNVTVDGKKWDDGHREGNVWRRFRDTTPVDSRPIVHRAIPIGAKVGSRYFFPDGMLHLRFDADKMQTYMTAQGATTTYYDFSAGWIADGDKTKRVVSNVGSVSTSQLSAGVAALFGDSIVAIRSSVLEVSGPIVVTVKQSILETMRTGNFPQGGILGCLEIAKAHNLTTETTSPNFTIRHGRTVCIAPYLEKDDRAVRSFKTSMSEKEFYMASRMVIYNQDVITKKKDIAGEDSIYTNAYRRASGYASEIIGDKKTKGIPLTLKKYVKMAKKNGEIPSQLRRVFRLHRLKMRNGRPYESTEHIYYYQCGNSCRKVTRRI